MTRPTYLDVTYVVTFDDGSTASMTIDGFAVRSNDSIASLVAGERRKEGAA